MDKALICDADPQILRLLAMVLIKMEYEVAAYRDGAAALQGAINISPDLVICDCFAPGVHGIRLFKTLRDHATLSWIPYILICYRDMKNVAEAAGCPYILLKPFTAPELLRMVRKTQPRR